MKYLDTGEMIAVEHIAKVITAHTLTDEDLSERSAKRLRDLSRAVRLYAEVREYAAAVEVAQSLLSVVKEYPEIRRVMERSIKTLERSAR